jgi:PEP-CTERM motif
MIRSYSWISAAALCLSVVATADAASMKFDLGDNTTQSPGNINDIVYNAMDVPNVIDTTGAATGVSLTVTSANGFNEVGPNRSGPLAPNAPASGYFDGETTRDAMFGHTVVFNGTGPRALIEYTIAGLNPALTYDFTFFAGRGAVSDNREAQYDVAGANAGVALLDAGNNYGNVAQVLGIAPTAGGELTLTIQPGPNNTSSNGFFYLGGLDINPVPEPASLCLMGLGGLLITARRRA